MFRIIRTATLDALRADSVALPAVRQERDQAKSEAERATDSAIRAENVAGDQLRQLAQLHADRFEAERETRAQYEGLHAVIKQVTAERDAARTERDQVEAAARAELDEIRQDVDRLRDAAADPETGEGIRHAIAYGVLRNLVDDVRARGLELGRPLDLVAVLLGFDAPPTDTEEPVPTGQ
ncbi:hypothetical protein KYY02_31270 [Streptomyces pimonensis]|uniref:Uncharacterized protein n=1 Tax=Streptomyces pimonensis TaxID=2860288 RepID=A0ABV4JC14_9ACTN